jgi:integrase
MASRKRVAPGTMYPWEGGYARVDDKGAVTYYVQRRYRGKRWHFALRARQAETALAQLRAWEADPWGFLASGGPPAELEPVRFTAALADEFLAWSEHSKRNSAGWVAKQRRFLTDARGALGEADLRRLSLTRDLLPYLDKVGTSKHQRIAVLKCFYAWLRKDRHLIGAAEDPTFGTLSVPQNQPEQWQEEKAFAKADYLKALGAMVDPRYRAAMVVQAATGWHVTETQRFAESGRVESLPATVENADCDVVLVCPHTKGGEPLKTRVSKSAGDAGSALREAGSLDYTSYWHALRAACESAGLAPDAVQPGSFRHSVATWAIEQGADPASVAAFLGHKSPRTTKKFYATHAVPKKVPTLA